MLTLTRISLSQDSTSIWKGCPRYGNNRMPYKGVKQELFMPQTATIWLYSFTHRSNMFTKSIVFSPNFAFSELMTFSTNALSFEPAHFLIRAIDFSNVNKNAVNCSSPAFVSLCIVSFQTAFQFAGIYFVCLDFFNVFLQKTGSVLQADEITHSNFGVGKGNKRSLSDLSRMSQ